MLRSIVLSATLAALAAPSAAQDIGSLLRPVTGNVHERTVRVDPSTGRVQSVPASLGGGGLESVFENTCPTGYYSDLNTQSQNGSGSTGPMAAGDWGAVPSTAFPGSATCTPGCADSYDITQFTFTYCTADGVPIDMVLHFWDRFATGSTGLNACDGVQLIGGTVPPVFPRAAYPGSPTGMADITLVGLPRSRAGTVVASCYAITVQLDAPGFRLNGGVNGLTNLSTMGDRFSWSMQVTSGQGNAGPFLAGEALFGSPCTFCAGTIWEAGGQSTAPGIGLGQIDRVWLDTYGGTTPSTGNCFFLGGNPWFGMDLTLEASDPCAGGNPFSSFCDASDGALAACPCANPGLPSTGCAYSPFSGGVKITALAQTTSPNAATLTGTGFSSTTATTAIVLRSDMLDPAGPVVFGDGVRCIGPTPLVRLAAATAGGGMSTHVFGHGAMASGGAFYYQLWYRSTPSTFCDPLAAFNLSNGVVLNW